MKPAPSAPDTPRPGDAAAAEKVAAALSEAADLLEAFGARRHRVRAYRQGADSLRRHAHGFARRLAEGRLTELPGIGPELAAKAAEVAATGTLEAVAALKARIPPEAADLTRVPGVDPKLAVYLAARLHVRTVAHLRQLAATHMLRAIPWLDPEAARRIEAGVRAVAGR